VEPQGTGPSGQGAYVPQAHPEKMKNGEVGSPGRLDAWPCMLLAAAAAASLLACHVLLFLVLTFLERAEGGAC